MRPRITVTGSIPGRGWAISETIGHVYTDPKALVSKRQEMSAAQVKHEAPAMKKAMKRMIFLQKSQMRTQLMSEE